MSLGTARARIAELEASLDVARLPARADQIEAQRAAVAALEAQLRQAQWELDERVVVSRVAARVEQLVRFAGERAPAGGAVLRLLPPDALKVRFFVPQGQARRTRSPASRSPSPATAARPTWRPRSASSPTRSSSRRR